MGMEIMPMTTKKLKKQPRKAGRKEKGKRNQIR